MNLRSLFRGKWFGFGVVVLLAACIPEAVEPTPTIERAPSLAPSATVLPIIPDEEQNNFVGRSDPTAAALAAEGQPDQDLEITPLPTDATIPMTIIADDGVILSADFYGAPQRPAPAILLLHSESGDTTELVYAAQVLQAAGYNTMLLHLRGYGRSGGSRDKTLIAQDALAALQTLQTLPAVSGVAVIGQGFSAVPAVLACTQHTDCHAIAIFDPLPNDELLPLSEAMTRVGVTPLMILAGEDMPAGLQTAQIVNAFLPVKGVYHAYQNLNLQETGIGSTIIDWFHEILAINATSP